MQITNLTYVMPCFIVSNLKVSVSSYIDKLGFEVLYIGPDENPYWARVGRDNISIFLKAVAPEIKPIPNHTRLEWAPSDAYISATEPDILYEEFRSRGLQFRKPLGLDDDKLLGSQIEDADGYVLFFGKPNL